VVARVESLEDALQSDQTRARQMTVEIPTDEGTIRIVGNPIKNDGVADSFNAPPFLGEHGHLSRFGNVS
jgi:crotonobetainyl-CoA:carnitine CoA-transferase CaiB-like acyl-CoA transferase